MRTLAAWMVVASAACAHDAPSSPRELNEKSSWFSAERPLMGTSFRVTLPVPESPGSRAAVERCFELFEHVDQVMSEWKPESPLSELNRQAGVAPVPLPEDLIDLLETSKRLSEETEGAFDVTWAALWGLWRFDGSNRIPTRQEVAAKLSSVGWRDLEIDRGAATAYLRRKGMAVGLGAVAKGHALDRCAGELRARGYPDFLLYAGGQVYGGGQKPGGPWRVGVQDPRGPTGDFFATVAMRDASASTSGDYERSFIKDGALYHHIIDLRTGYPARASRSATVLAKDATLADALSTACFVLGPERALALAQRLHFDVLLVDAAGRVHMSEGMKAVTTVHRAPRSRRRRGRGARRRALHLREDRVARRSYLPSSRR
jgi:FAD:protein FMN transferase